MSKTTRYLLLTISAVQLAFAVAFYAQWPPAIRPWPFEGTTPLTYIFIGSIFAAAAASTLWAIFTRNEGALAGIGLDYLVILTPLAAYMLWLGLTRGDSRLTTAGVLCAAGVVFGLWLFRQGRRWPLDMSVPMPALVRWSFVLFVGVLVFVSIRLFRQIPTIPWKVTPELSVVAGLLFLGAAAYFVYALLRPSWANAGGQLAGFLVYDLVLIGPLLRALATVAPENRSRLIIYLVIVIYSGLLAVYYLFIHKPTRLSVGRNPVSKEKPGF